jgi:cation diffusion facilitator family transporter
VRFSLRCGVRATTNAAEQSERRYDEAERTTYVSIVINTVLGVGKAVIGVSGHSLALMADAVHTLSDTLTSVAVWVGLRVARRPADEVHPYGHGKAEAIAGKVVAIALFLVAGGVAYQAVGGIARFALGGGELARPTSLTLYAALVSILVKELMYQYQARIGRRLNSIALLADAWHHRSDALSSIGVAVGIAAATLGGPKWHWADEAAALVVAAFIFWVAWNLFKRSAAGLMDALAPGETVAEIRRVARSVEGVLGVEKTFARLSGLDILVDIHVEVDGRITVEKGHEIATAVTRKLTESIPQVTHALVHIEPHRGA